MLRDTKEISSAELEKVLFSYDIGSIASIKPLLAGNALAPKLVITSDKGTYLLKRRHHGKDDPARVAFAHSIQLLLAKQRFPLASLIASRQGDTMLYFDKHLYEIFDFVIGSRYDGSAESTIDAGRQLACFHTAVAKAIQPWFPTQGVFHDSPLVRRHLTAVRTGKHFEKNTKFAALIASLTELYEIACLNVTDLGFNSWRKQITHSDWHPGNMLFANGKVVAVLDFDSMKPAPVITDIANGMLHFSIVAGRPNPAHWPEYLDQAKLVQFLTGYKKAGKIDRGQLKATPDLMIEALIAEAVAPIAATGYFGNLSGHDFLRMIYRKCRWIDENRDTLNEAIFAL
jgi:Ser/Thr protein kinase RdoA (MazF antagonist)